MDITKPTLIEPEAFVDNRGKLYAYNSLNFQELDIKRTFFIDVKDFRGWHGHKHEKNWFKVTSGMLKILLVKPDNWSKPSFNIEPDEYVLNARNHTILFIPSGYVSAIKSLKENSTLQVFSDKKVEESIEDDYRFDSDRWYYETFM